ncbi:Survival motor neuron [Lasallia pustulata]|uniref:Survival motor neuron n=1 Tax=Lasallia pustulata TaxID=136370 RepID=A0A1W5DCL9_9LECA|nr:Survival motor neuron [Lasallia pustulata]
MGKKKKQQVSQAEIWDDSALIRSWDDALAEYKLYHSIHARGERVEDVLRDIEAQEEGTVFESAATNGGQDRAEAVDSEMLEDGEVADEEEKPVRQDEGIESTDPATSSPNAHHYHQQAPGANDGGYGPGAPTMPNAVLGRVEDEALKNLMMSWYFAGYYTGLYEGQQQAAQTPAQRPSGDRKEAD